MFQGLQVGLPLLPFDALAAANYLFELVYNDLWILAAGVTAHDRKDVDVR